jgi:hypothetical protein|tara:strand:- start:528 stop:719 length:192 start_codon:yes stop_codon:yes gene_type:complete
MKHWLQSLSENGFDVFIVVYLAILLLSYHYLLRWYIDIKFKKIEKEIDKLNELSHHIIDEVEG